MRWQEAKKKIPLWIEIYERRFAADTKSCDLASWSFARVCVCQWVSVKPGPDVLGASLQRKPAWNVLELACCHSSGWADNTLKHCVLWGQSACTRVDWVSSVLEVILRHNTLERLSLTSVTNEHKLHVFSICLSVYQSIYLLTRQFHLDKLLLSGLAK